MNDKSIQHITNNELFNQARELTSLASQLQSYCRLLTMLETAQIKKDTFTLHCEIETGVFGELRDNLKDLSSNVQRISDTICPLD